MTGIISLHSENVKRLRAVRIEPKQTGLVIIGGKNRNGKTSVLDSIDMVLNGGKTVPKDPIHHGEYMAQSTLDLGDLIATRKFTQKGSTIVVKSKDGATLKSPQAILDKLVGKITFDPHEFATMDAKSRAETLRNLIGLDVSDLDEKRSKLYDERTEVNRDVKRLESQLSSMTRHDDAPDEPVVVKELMDQLDEISQFNRENENHRKAVTEAETAVTNAKTEVEKNQAEVARIEEMLERAKVRLVASEGDLKHRENDLKESIERAEKLEDKDAAPVREAIDNAEEANRKLRENQERAQVSKKLMARSSEAKTITAEIDRIDSEKRKRLSSAKYPIEGLGFSSSGDVVFNGVPFEQWSSAEAIEVSASIGMALNPVLTVMMVRNGSLMDEDALARLEQLALDKGYQVWVERVGEGPECSVIIEDGEIKEVQSDADQDV